MEGRLKDCVFPELKGNVVRELPDDGNTPVEGIIVQVVSDEVSILLTLKFEIE